MEIKDLAMTVELGTEMADVRGGARQFNIGNIGVSRLSSANYSQISNGSVAANTAVFAGRASGSTFSNIGSAVTYAPSNNVSQTSGIALDITSMFSGFNVA